MQTQNCGPGPSILLTDGASALQFCPLDIDPGDYEVEVTLTNLDPNAECNDTNPNSAKITIAK